MMTGQEALAKYRANADQLAELAPLAEESDQSPEARRARNEMERIRQSQEKLQARLDRLGVGHLTQQRGRHHEASCTCRICWPTGTGVEFRIRVDPELKAALAAVPRERILEALEALTR